MRRESRNAPVKLNKTSGFLACRVFATVTEKQRWLRKAARGPGLN
jgi:hypothetical protein